MQINPEPDLLKVGGKAYHLYRLQEVCDVPSFFTVSFEHEGEIDSPAVQQELLDYCEKQGFDLVAVRSSATLEDSSRASFAGLFETILNVKSTELIPAINTVLASVSSDRVGEYRAAQGLSDSHLGMSIIVQKMVFSRISGVCFTRVAYESNSLIVEACFGLGEVIVSGKITPDTYIIDRKTLFTLSQNIGYQKIMLLPAIAGYQDVPIYRRNARKMTDAELKAVAITGLSIEEHLSMDSVDIEWAFEDNMLYILQARRYTGIDSRN